MADGTEPGRRSAESPVDTAPAVADEIRTTTCYMCACRCGIRVHLKNGAVRYIDGNPDHPVNRGVICAKGASGIMQQHSPARLSKPLLRVGPRGAGEFREIEWDEALALAAGWLQDIRARAPRELAFFTGRDQSQSFTGWWAQQFGTVNYAAHGGFCSVNMAAAGLYSIGGSFWEFGEPDWAHTRLLLLFGVAEDHASNPIKIGLGQLKARPGTKLVSINPVRTGYSAIADEWLAITPGSDGLLVAALINELLAAEKIDWPYLARYTNAAWLVIDDPGAPDHGLFARDAEGRALCVDARSGALVPAPGAEAPRFVGAVETPDGRRAAPAFEGFARRFLDPCFEAEAVAPHCGIPAARIRALAAELAAVAFEQTIALPGPWIDAAGREHAEFIGRPISMHAMRGISAHANGFHTCRLIHALQMLLGTIDVPGGFRYKPPFPRPIPPPGSPATGSAPGQPLTRMPLGFPRGPEYLLHDADGKPERLDQAFSWEFPLALHGLLHTVIHNAWKGDPYPIDTLFLYMANMAWNSAMDVPATLAQLCDRRADGEYRIPRIVYVDAYYSETVPYADLVLPDTTYLERWDCISLLDRPISDANGAADAIRQPVVAPDRDVRPFQDVLLDLGARLGLPGMTREDGSPRYPGGYRDYLEHHMRANDVGPLAGWRGEDGSLSFRGAPNPSQLERYVENGCFFRAELPPTLRYYRFANRAYLEHAVAAGWIGAAQPIVLELYSEILQKFRLAATGHGELQPPAPLRARLREHCDPLPLWQPLAPPAGDYPLHAITQRPMHMYHSWGAQNAWLRQISARNVLYVHPEAAAAAGLADGDWAWILAPGGRVKAQVQTMRGVNPHTVWTWNALGKRRGAWGLAADAPESTQGFLLNHLIPTHTGPARAALNADPLTGQAAWFDLRVRLEKCRPQEAGATAPLFEVLPARAHAPEILRRGLALKGEATGRTLDTPREYLGGSAQAEREGEPQ
ncbi:MAG TPA: molybdopterin-dependent oxidoreductase [Gammaproteobacteria bacterium]|nr:molybdopterin-dependent oxidoreductase [Gammaproteobacteria bacterium]